MKKILLAIIFITLLIPICYSQPSPSNPVVSAISAVKITNNGTTNTACRAVWIGTSQSVDFYFGAYGWVTFQGATAGTVIPIQVTGARITSGSAAPASGDIVFLY